MCLVRWAGRGLLFLLFFMGTECHNGERGVRNEQGEVLLLLPGPAGRSHSTKTKQAFLQIRLCWTRGDQDPCLLVHLHFLLMRVAGMFARETGLPFGCEKLDVDHYFPLPFSCERLRRLRDFFSHPVFRNKIRTETLSILDSVQIRFWL